MRGRQRKGDRQKAQDLAGAGTKTRHAATSNASPDGSKVNPQPRRPAPLTTANHESYEVDLRLLWCFTCDRNGTIPAIMRTLKLVVVVIVDQQGLRIGGYGQIRRP